MKYRPEGKGIMRLVVMVAIVGIGLNVSNCTPSDDDSPNQNPWPRIEVSDSGQIINAVNLCPKLSSVTSPIDAVDSDYIICEKQQHNKQIACDQNKCGQWACGYGPATDAGNACVQKCSFEYYNNLLDFCKGKSLKARSAPSQNDGAL